jgi:hypothetical protein
MRQKNNFMAIELFGNDVNRFIEIVCQNLNGSKCELKRILRLEEDDKNNWKYGCAPYLDPSKFKSKVTVNNNNTNGTEEKEEEEIGNPGGLFVTIAFPKEDYLFLLAQFSEECHRYQARQEQQQKAEHHRPQEEEQ